MPSNKYQAQVLWIRVIESFDPRSLFSTRLSMYNKVGYSRCAPMYGKCRLLR